MSIRTASNAADIETASHGRAHHLRWNERLGRERLQALLAPCDVAIGGSRPWDITIHEPRFFSEALTQGTLGVGEAYMAGWWDCERLDELMTRVWAAGIPDRLSGISSVLLGLRARLLNLQSSARAWAVGKLHYDVGNELFQAMLDRRMIYSCGYWPRAATLDGAQEAKLDLIARKLGFEPGMRVLDVGCGWGGALAYFAERCGVSGVGITISAEQANWAQDACRHVPVEIRLQDYRNLGDLGETFDRVYSIGMFEHVGVRNYRRYFEVMRRCLRKGGLFLLHTIGSARSVVHSNPWLSKYIFPNSMLPSVRQIAAACESLVTMEDWHNFGADYDRTLMAWHRNFTQAWPALQRRYDETFRRMWNFYLLSCAGYFRSRQAQLWQVVFSRDGVPGGYRAEGIR
jgi:cyclopropane-fatty-acyl-phospholipid synthase